MEGPKPKPILVIGMPGEDNETPEIDKSFKKLTSEYWVIIYPIPRHEPEFKVFFEKDFDEVKFEGVKQFIKDQMKNQ